jgi:hypothetical protein
MTQTHNARQLTTTTAPQREPQQQQRIAMKQKGEGVVKQSRLVGVAILHCISLWPVERKWHFALLCLIPSCSHYQPTITRSHSLTCLLAITIIYCCCGSTRLLNSFSLCSGLLVYITTRLNKSCSFLIHPPSIILLLSCVINQFLLDWLVRTRRNSSLDRYVSSDCTGNWWIWYRVGILHRHH